MVILSWLPIVGANFYSGNKNIEDLLNMNKKLNVLPIHYGRHLFETGTADRNRMVACAEAYQSLYVIVFSLRKHGLFTQKVNEKITFYPTNARTRVGMVIKAVTIGLSIWRQSNQGATWVIKAQDPFECGLIGFIIRLKTRIPLNIQEYAGFFNNPYWRREQSLNQVRYLFGLWLLRRFDSVRTVSDKIAENLLNRSIRSDHLHMLPITINVDSFALRTPRRFDRETINIISVARLVRVKNFPFLIEAFSLALTQVPNLRLTLVGSGTEQDFVLSLEKIGYVCA